MTDSQSANQSWCLAPSGTRNQFFFLLEIIFRQWRVCYFVAPSLTRGRICNILLMLILNSAVCSGLSPMGFKTIFYCPNSWDSPNLESQVPVFISPRNMVAEIYHQSLGSFSVISYTLHGILSSLYTGLKYGIIYFFFGGGDKITLIQYLKHRQIV
jgi:hypothetical protein